MCRDNARERWEKRRAEKRRAEKEKSVRDIDGELEHTPLKEASRHLRADLRRSSCRRARVRRLRGRGQLPGLPWAWGYPMESARSDRREPARRAHCQRSPKVRSAAMSSYRLAVERTPACALREQSHEILRANGFPEVPGFRKPGREKNDGLGDDGSGEKGVARPNVVRWH